MTPAKTSSLRCLRASESEPSEPQRSKKLKILQISFERHLLLHYRTILLGLASIRRNHLFNEIRSHTKQPWICKHNKKLLSKKIDRFKYRKCIELWKIQQLLFRKNVCA